MDAAGGDPDRISALPDDVLHVILGFLPDVTAASRTAVLSRRWRRVWTHARGLLFLDTKVRGGAVAGGFASFLDWAFAQRGCADVGSLSIHVYHMCTKPERVNEWIRYATRRVTGSFVLELPEGVGRSRRRDCGDQPTIEVPSHGRMTTISLYLSECRLQLPVAGAAARYGALTELVLYAATFHEEEGPGGGRALGDFVTSCCPRLRKLCVLAPRGLSRLVLRAKELEELHLGFATDLRTLDATVPKLRLLKLLGCFLDGLVSGNGNDNVVSKLARIAALRLEDIHMNHNPHYRRPHLDMYDLASVRRLGDLRLDMHGRYCHVMDTGLWLLDNCPGVEHVDVELLHSVISHKCVISGDFVDLTLEGTKQFVSVRSMIVKLRLSPEPHEVASMSALLMRFPRLRSLCIQIIWPISYNRLKRFCKCFCDDLNISRSHKENFLEYLGEVKISGFTGAKEEMDLVTLLFEISNSFKSMTLSDIKARKRFKQEHRCSGTKSFSLFGDYDDDAKEEEDEVEVEAEENKDNDEEEQAIMKQELMKIPSTDRGRWYFEEDEYTWTR